MKARLQAALPQGNQWLFELKLDGIRAVAVKDGARVQLFSRLPRELTAEHPRIVEAIQRLPVRSAVVDGEIVALDERGRSSFQLLQNRRRNAAGTPPILYYVFDLIHLDGHDLKSLPLVTRRELLEKLLKHSAQPLRLSEALTAPAAVVWKEVTRHGLEGLVAKQKPSPYEPGRRTGAWVKIKAQLRQEFVIGGYTSPEGARTHFGALLVGYYQGARLVFASGVGTGFDQATLKTLHDRFQSLRRADCPFANLPTPSEAGRRQGMTAAEMRRCVWLKPELVCEVRFAEWTQDGCLRQPVYLGLRADKKPRQVRREDPA